MSTIEFGPLPNDVKRIALIECANEMSLAVLQREDRSISIVATGDQAWRLAILVTAKVKRLGGDAAPHVRAGW